MAGAAATKGQQNVTRTRPYSGCDHVPVTRVGDTPQWNGTDALSLVFTRAHNTPIMLRLVWHQGAGP